MATPSQVVSGTLVKVLKDMNVNKGAHGTWYCIPSDYQHTQKHDSIHLLWSDSYLSGPRRIL